MINSAKSHTIEDYMEILRRRMWYIIIPFFLVALGAIIYVIIAPREYKASTLVLVTPQRVPEAFVPTTVTSRIDERLQSIAQEVMSRTRLEQIISELNLYRKERKSMSQEEVIALMQKNIKVELPTKKEEKGYFTISYIGANPTVVTTVANRLSSLFIEENLKIREQQAVGTTEFLTNELAASKTKLDVMETSIAQYKRKYMGELPEQRDTNLKILEQLQNQYQRLGESARSAQDRKLFIQKQLSDMEAPPPAKSQVPETAASDSKSKNAQAMEKPAPVESAGSYETQRETLKRTLEELQSKYKDSHPDVTAAKKKLADFESNKESRSITKDPRYRELYNQLTQTDMEIKRLTVDEGSISTQIARFRARLEAMPMREQDMASLVREYQNTKETYDTLLKKSQEAQQAENLEKRQKGEQFKVIDPARTPEKPFSPDVPKILLVGLLAGLASGLGLAFLREQMDRSFHDAEDAELTLGLNALAIIPRIEEEKSGYV